MEEIKEQIGTKVEKILEKQGGKKKYIKKYFQRKTKCMEVLCSGYGYINCTKGFYFQETTILSA